MGANNLSLMRGNLKVNFMKLNRFPSEIFLHVFTCSRAKKTGAFLESVLNFASLFPLQIWWKMKHKENNDLMYLQSFLKHCMGIN